jgi:hypothetical protein
MVGWLIVCYKYCVLHPINRKLVNDFYQKWGKNDSKIERFLNVTDLKLKIYFQGAAKRSSL